MYKVLIFLYFSILTLASIAMVFWPLPAFLLDAKDANDYFDFIFGQTGSQDKSRFAALPFFWFFFTLPIGIALVPLGYFIFEFVVFMYKLIKRVIK